MQIGNHQRAFEYDGAYRCFACEARWGALPGNPKMPEECAMNHLNQEPLDFAASITLLRQARRDLIAALALLRELNDALVIPGWLQPRVDAVLDGHEHKAEGKWCVFTQQFDCRTLGDCNDNGCHRNRNFSQPQEEK